MRYVLIDRITRLAPPEADAVKCVSLSDDTFLDHFPGHPILPGALLIESMAQLGGVLVEQTMRDRGRSDLHAVLTTIEKAKFRQAVRPGDKVMLTARCEAASEDGGRVTATARVDDQPVAEATLTFAFARITSPTVLAKRREYLNVWLTGSSEGSATN